MRRLVALVSMACGAPAIVRAQVVPDSLRHGPEVVLAYDERTDSTTLRVSAYAIVDTSRTPPDTFAVELRQQWRGRETIPPVGSVELGIGRTRTTGLRGGRSVLGGNPRQAAVVLMLASGRQIRLERNEYASDAGRAVPTFETAWYRIPPADLRRVAETREIRVRVGDRELWVDPGWRNVVADVVAGQGAPGGVRVRT